MRLTALGRLAQGSSPRSRLGPQIPWHCVTRCPGNCRAGTPRSPPRARRKGAGRPPGAPSAAGPSWRASPCGSQRCCGVPREGRSAGRGRRLPAAIFVFLRCFCANEHNAAVCFKARPVARKTTCGGLSDIYVGLFSAAPTAAARSYVVWEQNDTKRKDTKNTAGGHKLRVLATALRRQPCGCRIRE